MSKSLYQRILSDKYPILPPKVQELHDHINDVTYAGKCKVVRGDNILTIMLAKIW